MLTKSILEAVWPGRSAKGPVVSVVGAGVSGLHIAAMLLHRGLRVRLLSSQVEPVAGKLGVGILERQGETIRLIAVDGTRIMESVEWEDETFSYYREASRQGARFCEWKWLEYHRENPTSDPFYKPFKGMEAQELTGAALNKGYPHGVGFTALIINVNEVYDALRDYVFEHPNFEGCEERHITNPDEIDAPLSVIACGMGSVRWDPAMYPGLGETVVVEKAGIDREQVLGGIKTGWSANIVPVPHSDRRFILGAGKQDGQYRPKRGESLADAIEAEAIRLRPDLAGATRVSVRNGVRPKRQGGTLVTCDAYDGRLQVQVCGLGGCGWTFGWGLSRWVSEQIETFVG